MINFEKLWNNSAAQYHTYAMQYPQYQKLNAKLVALANITPHQTIIDLACGTGLTTQAVLQKCPEIAKIYAVDFSKEMVQVAQENISSPKVVFITASAESVDKVIPEKVDIVVCNAAFWQFENKAKVLQAVRKVLQVNGRLIFNLNQQFFDFGTPEPTQQLVIETILKHIRIHGFATRGKLKPKLTMSAVEKVLIKAGFIVEKIEHVDLGPRSLQELFDFFTIPATATFFATVPKNIQPKILAAAYAELQNSCRQTARNEWIYFVCRIE